MQHLGSKYFVRRPPTSPHDPRGWVKKVKMQLFSKHCQVGYQIKGIVT